MQLFGGPSLGPPAFGPNLPRIHTGPRQNELEECYKLLQIVHKLTICTKKAEKSPG